jgi:hypothetical protein
VKLVDYSLEAAAVTRNAVQIRIYILQTQCTRPRKKQVQRFTKIASTGTILCNIH